MKKLILIWDILQSGFFAFVLSLLAVGIVWAQSPNREDNIAVGLGKVCTRVAAIEKRLLEHDVLRGHEQCRILELERKVEGMQKQITILHAKKADKRAASIMAPGEPYGGPQTEILNQGK